MITIRGTVGRFKAGGSRISARLMSSHSPTVTDRRKRYALMFLLGLAIRGARCAGPPNKRLKLAAAPSASRTILSWLGLKMRDLIMSALVATAGCTTIHPRQRTVPLQQLRTPHTIAVTASSALSGRPMTDDSLLIRQIIAAVWRRLPGTQVVAWDADSSEMQLIFVMVDYVPGCKPNCGKFPTYRNWSCTVLSGFGQAFALDGETYDPFYSATDNCLSGLARVLKEAEVQRVTGRPAKPPMKLP